MILDQIRGFLKSDKDFKLPANLTDDHPLITTGAIDSFSIVKLVVFLEKTFAIKVNPEDLTEKNFNTLKNIERFLLQKTGKASGS